MQKRLRAEANVGKLVGSQKAKQKFRIREHKTTDLAEGSDRRMTSSSEKRAIQSHLISPQIGVIIPSFNDARILHTIRSVIDRDPTQLTRLYIIDGGSRPEIIELILNHIRPHDYCTTERDKGIFDALNKGLDLVGEEIVTWLGADDFFTKHLDFAAVVNAFRSENLDCYVFDLIFVDKTRVRRRTRAFAATSANILLGRHVSHFSSFWRRSMIGSTRFNLNYPIAADQDFFCKMTKPRPPKTKLDHRVGTIQRLGGNSTKDVLRILKANAEVYRIFRHYLGPVGAGVSTVCKLMRKSLNQLIPPRYAIIDEMTELFLESGRAQGISVFSSATVGLQVAPPGKIASPRGVAGLGGHPSGFGRQDSNGSAD